MHLYALMVCAYYLISLNYISYWINWNQLDSASLGNLFKTVWFYLRIMWHAKFNLRIYKSLQNSYHQWSATYFIMAASNSKSYLVLEYIHECILLLVCCFFLETLLDTGQSLVCCRLVLFTIWSMSPCPARRPRTWTISISEICMCIWELSICLVDESFHVVIRNLSNIKGIPSIKQRLALYGQRVIK